MKNLLFIFFIFFSISFVFPQTYHLNVNLKNGTTTTYEVANIVKIDFSDIMTRLEDAKKFASILKSFKLMQNYPNPFNPYTNIPYEIPKMGKVEVNIYDVNGRLIKNLVNENQQPGSYKIIWNGKNEKGIKVSSGLYIYQVKLERTTLSQKMVLLK